MTRSLLPALAIASGLLSGCASDPANFVKALDGYADAANKLDPDCYKKVHAEIMPLIMPWGPLPFLSGSYDKLCHPELGPDGNGVVTPRAGLVVGRP